MISRNSLYSGQTSARISPARAAYASKANLEAADKSETFQSIMEFEQKLNKDVRITSSQYQVKPTTTAPSNDYWSANVTSEINEAAGSSEVVRNNLQQQTVKMGITEHRSSSLPSLSI